MVVMAPPVSVPVAWHRSPKGATFAGQRGAIYLLFGVAVAGSLARRVGA
ncbi:MAG TPA: hypothetical protein VGS16_11630 [Candidatus Dormibacteraeota bacterium]|nr:hypothetical protein [Candidatus Dormibacteraeota bacterium]